MTERQPMDFGKGLALGGLRLPQFDVTKVTEIDMESLKEIVDAFQAGGYNYYDTSWFYHGGHSETALGELVIDRYPREQILFSNKMPLKFMTKQEQMEEVFEKQLRKCHVDYFDFYLLHQLGIDLYDRWENFGIFEFLMQKREEGKIRYFGASFHQTPEFVDKVLTEHPELDFVMLQLNYIDWDSPTLRARELYDVAVKHDKPIVVMEACKGGILANVPDEAQKLMKDYNPDASIASWAYRWVKSLPQVGAVTVGMPKMEFLLDNMKTFDDFKPMNDEEYAIIDKVIDIINSQTAIACTNCKYCEEVCPKNIAIGDYFALYNEGKRQNLGASTYWNEVDTQVIQYTNIIEERGKASDCINCKKCERICPQHLEVVKYLAENIVPEIEMMDPTLRIIDQVDN